DHLQPAAPAPPRSSTQHLLHLQHLFRSSCSPNCTCGAHCSQYSPSQPAAHYNCCLSHLHSPSLLRTSPPLQSSHHLPLLLALYLLPTHFCLHALASWRCPGTVNPREARGPLIPCQTAEAHRHRRRGSRCCHYRRSPSPQPRATRSTSKSRSRKSTSAWRCTRRCTVKTSNVRSRARWSRASLSEMVKTSPRRFASSTSARTSPRSAHRPATTRSIRTRRSRETD